MLGSVVGCTGWCWFYGCWLDGEDVTTTKTTINVLLNKCLGFGVLPTAQTGALTP